jgi:outer membrane lipoprotein-sorting protein
MKGQSSHTRDRRRAALPVLLLFAAAAAGAQNAEQILQRLEDSQHFRTQEAEGTLVITDRFGARTKSFHSYAEGEDHMLLAFTNPEEKGQKILRLAGEIYLYFPEAEEVLHLQGAALKESVLGSDFSYEDLTAEESLLSRYEPRLAGREPIEGREYFVLELKARKRGAAYPMEKIWVDAERYVLRRAEYYALSGKLLKDMEVLEVKEVSGRFVMTRAIMRDRMKKDSSTELRLGRLRLDEPLPRDIFSLERLSW